ncbi:MAG: hypothetical protein Q9220_004003 [cf. Caloplaca sp. 1 TL-2023]
MRTRSFLSLATILLFASTACLAQEPPAVNAAGSRPAVQGAKPAPNQAPAVGQAPPAPKGPQDPKGPQGPNNKPTDQQEQEPKEEPKEEEPTDAPDTKDDSHKSPESKDNDSEPAKPKEPPELKPDDGSTQSAAARATGTRKGASKTRGAVESSTEVAASTTSEEARTTAEATASTSVTSPTSATASVSSPTSTATGSAGGSTSGVMGRRNVRLGSVGLAILIAAWMTTVDPFDSLFELEDTFYKEGYDLGAEDGRGRGLIEGRLFGLEKSFEKYAAMGKLHGRSVIWTGRLSHPEEGSQSTITCNDDEASGPSIEKLCSAAPGSRQETSTSLLQIQHNPRLEKHIRTLYALTEPASLSTENSEDAVSDFDDRLRRAVGKVKIIEKLNGEELRNDTLLDAHGNVESLVNNPQPSSTKRDGGIEDVSVLRARH